jgi:hypothetical protein
MKRRKEWWKERELYCLVVFVLLRNDRTLKGKIYKVPKVFMQFNAFIIMAGRRRGELWGWGGCKG